MSQPASPEQPQVLVEIAIFIPMADGPVGPQLDKTDREMAAEAKT